MSARPTGAQILALARTRIGEPYTFGASVPKNDSDWRGPWDCAEFASWLVYQTTRTLYGCAVTSHEIAPAQADAYTGYWARDARLKGTRIPIADAMRIPGAFLLRVPGERRGHIAVSDGLGGTVEAHSARRGVCEDTARGRLWTTGVLVPGIDYMTSGGVPA